MMETQILTLLSFDKRDLLEPSHRSIKFLFVHSSKGMLVSLFPSDNNVLLLIRQLRKEDVYIQINFFLPIVIFLKHFLIIVQVN